MIAQPKKWLETIPWECVVEQNQKLCETARVAHEVIPERHEQVRKLWETVAAREMDLEKVLDALQQCHAQGPFRYNNLNTFSAIARKLVDGAAQRLPAVEACILSATTSQYVEGKISKTELRLVVAHFDKQLQAAPLEVAVPPTAAPVRAQSLAT